MSKKIIIISAIFALLLTTITVLTSSKININKNPNPLPQLSNISHFSNSELGLEFDYNPKDIKVYFENGEIKWEYISGPPGPTSSISKTTKTYDQIIQEFDSPKYPKPTHNPKSNLYEIYNELLSEENVTLGNQKAIKYVVSGGEAESINYFVAKPAFNLIFFSWGIPDEIINSIRFF